eukprot:jgi/Mesvir1/13405/Mv16491-RA.2
MGLESIQVLYDIPEILLWNAVATDPAEVATAQQARNSPDVLTVLLGYLTTAEAILRDIRGVLTSRQGAATPGDTSIKESGLVDNPSRNTSDKEAVEVILGCAILLAGGDWDGMAPWADDNACRQAATGAILALSPTVPDSTTKSPTPHNRSLLDDSTAAPAIGAIVSNRLPSLLRILWARLGAENAELGVQGSGALGRAVPPDCGLLTPHTYISALQLLWCIRQVAQPQLEVHCGALFPTILRGLDHTKQCVKRVAMRALLATVERVSPTSVRVHGDVLLDAVRSALIGCEVAVWPQALEAAVATVWAYTSGVPAARGAPVMGGIVAAAMVTVHPPLAGRNGLVRGAVFQAAAAADVAVAEGGGRRNVSSDAPVTAGRDHRQLLASHERPCTQAGKRLGTRLQTPSRKGRLRACSSRRCFLFAAPLWRSAICNRLERFTATFQQRRSLTCDRGLNGGRA